MISLSINGKTVHLSATPAVINALAAATGKRCRRLPV